MTNGKIEKRGSRRRKVKPVTLIVTEGSQTEPRYFDYFRTRQKNIEIQIIGNKQKGSRTDYLSLVKKAIEYKNKNQISTFYGDQIWIVADGDVNYNNPDPIRLKNTQLMNARNLAAKNDINIALSNPCFELWYLMHFKYSTSYLKDYNAVASLLKNYISDYDKKSDIAEILSPHLTNAIHNAAKLEDYHRDNGKLQPFGIDANPFTDVYKLIKTLK
ncbi:RloB family protein [Emergencia timonensis]|uniref:RloB family protein n=1 Tax=Emergencia timonensis TaxID=1776384 RepID=UPI003994CA24